MPKSETQRAAEVLADTILAGEFAPAPLAERASRHLVKPWRGLASLIEALDGQFGTGTRPARRELIAAIRRHGIETKHFDCDSPSRPTMCAARGNPSTWELPGITTPNALARWFDLTLPELQWFARPWRDSPQQHYLHHWTAKRRGGHRLIERPKDALKFIQRQILHHILDHIPPHDVVHSFRAARNVVSYARPHCARPLLLRLDIADFFPSLQAGRVRALFRTAGYPDAVAGLLADLCCQATPAEILTEAPSPLTWAQKRRLRSPHLPQGAPTSPALSNLLGYRLDCRLAGLAASLGADYTRYADDLAFSGDRRIANIAPLVAAILIEEGFTPNHRKTRLQRKGTRQRLAGTIVNSGRPNLARGEFDRLKAILHNGGRDGIAEDQRYQLAGKISWVRLLNPQRGEKLQRLFDQVRWVAATSRRSV